MVFMSQNLLDLIGKTEGADYGTLVGGEERPLETMTVREILELQDEMEKDPEKYLNSTAVGKYQLLKQSIMELLYIPVGSTELEDGSKRADYATKGDKSGPPELKLRNPSDFNLDTVFDKKAQDFAGKALLERSKKAAVKTAEELGISKKEAEALEIAKTWASFPDPRTGESYYSEDGINNSHVDIQKVYDALGDKVVYRSEDLKNLNKSDPKRYEALNSKIVKAYSEGRVRDGAAPEGMSPS